MSLSFHVVASRGDFQLDLAASTGSRVLAVQGASGAGKTTLLYALAGLLPVRRIQLSIDGRSRLDSASGLMPPPHRRRIGFVFQDARLFPHLSVADNVAFGRRRAPRAISVREALSLVDLAGFEGRWPKHLSGGEARRVAIARALCSDPELLLLDEPFAGLDEARRDALMPYLKRLRDETDVPMILVSHDPRDIAALAQDSVRLSAGRASPASDRHEARRR